MNSFLDEISKSVVNKYKEYHNITVIFPSRRAGLFFKKNFSKYIKIPLWSPEVLSLTDFITKHSELEVKDSLTLIFELYNVYIKYFPEESFDNFIHWGEIIINDFDIIDKYLADAKQVFKSIKNWKELEDRFPPEIPEEYKIFWKSVIDLDTSEKKSFVKTWEILEKIYNEYILILKSKKIAYEGLALRELHNNLLSGKEIKKEKIIFAGFYAFSKSEEEIISYLIQKGKVEIYFDVDNFYIENKNQEAGHHIRNSIERFKNVIKKNNLKEEDYLFIVDANSLFSKNKEIFIIGAPLQVGISKAVGSTLKDLMEKDSFILKDKNLNELLNNLVIILPDESILLQVLYSLPDEIKEFNVSVGFPFKDTSLFSLLLLIKDLYENSIKVEKKILFHYADIQRILLHPYIRFIDVDLIFKIINTINLKNIIYSSVIYDMELKEILEENNEALEVIRNIFSTLNDDIEKAIEYIKSLILTITKRIEKSKDEYYKKFQFEYIFYFYKEFEKLTLLISKYKTKLRVNTLFKILISIYKKLYIPFSGEPVKGMQIMGLLESRNLDFENVFVLSMNEGIVPSTGFEYSFIPYNLRKSFKLPTFEDNNSIEAYFFYRLIQRAKNIFLFYDTEVSNYSKEKSRFLLQIEKDVYKFHKKITNKILSLKTPAVKILPITINKNEEVLSLLLNLEHISPTALITYLDCKLKFYLDRVLNLEEIKTPSEELEDATIGNIFHKIMELIYLPFKNQTVNKEDIETLLYKEFNKDKFDKLFNSAVKLIVEKTKRNIDFEYSSKNKLIKDVIKDFVKITLEKDKELTSFKIIELEKQVELPFHIEIGCNKTKTISLKGIIDRIDLLNDIERIVDYKTGKKYFIEFNPDKTDEFFQKIFSFSKFKDSFQILFYSYIYSELKGKTNFSATIFYPKEQEYKYLLKTVDRNIEEEYYKDFYDNLISLIQEIYNPDVPFTQTEDEATCDYCIYKNICYR